MTKKSRRVGSITLGATLLGVGLALLAHNFGNVPIWADLWRLWPALPLLLGLEYLGRQYFSRRQHVAGQTEEVPSLRLDGAALFLAIFALLGGIVYTAIPTGIVGMQSLLGIWRPYEYQTQVYQEFTDLTDIQSFTVTNRYGGVRIEGTDENKIEVTATVRAWARTPEEAAALARQTEIAFGGQPGLRLGSPDFAPSSSGSRRTIDYEVRVPKALVTSAEVVFGSLEARNITAAALVCRNGNLDAANLQGNAHVEDIFGSITVRGVQGSLEVVSKNGQVEVEKVQGRVTVQNEFGNVVLRDVAGPLDVDARHGNVSVTSSQPLTWDWSLSGHFGNVEVTIPQDSSVTLTALTQSGSLNLPGWAIVSKDLNKSAASGRQGAGEHTLRLESSQGSIELITR